MKHSEICLNKQYLISVSISYQVVTHIVLQKRNTLETPFILNDKFNISALNKCNIFISSICNFVYFKF